MVTPQDTFREAIPRQVRPIDDAQIATPNPSLEIGQRPQEFDATADGGGRDEPTVPDGHLSRRRLFEVGQGQGGFVYGNETAWFQPSVIRGFGIVGKFVECNCSGNTETMQTGVRRFGPKKLAVLAVIVASAITTYLVLGRYLSLEQLAEQEAGLRQLQSQFPVLVFAAAFVIYVSVTGLSLPGATVLTLLYAWYFGFWPALGLVSCARPRRRYAGLSVESLFVSRLVSAKVRGTVGGFQSSLAARSAYYLFTLP